MQSQTQALLLDAPITTVKGVGDKVAKQLARLNIFTVKDLLFHFPFRYQDRTKLQTIRQAKIGEEIVIEGIIREVFSPPKGKTKLLCELQDESGSLTLRFFHLLSFLSDTLKVGARFRCYGELKLGPTGKELVHPDCKLIREQEALPLEPYLTPTYPTVDGVNQYLLRKLTTNALQLLANKKIPEVLPLSLINAFQLPTFYQALSLIHRPPQATIMMQLETKKTLAHSRLIIEELLAHRLGLLKAKALFKEKKGIVFPSSKKWIQLFIENLPFQLTNAQQKVIAEINQDFSLPLPMLRLVQGDVGSGKTVVAAIAMLRAVESGYQAALMAPTELLAEQHYRVFKRWLHPFGLNIIFLTGSIKASDRLQHLQTIASGEAQVIIGTHALFQQQVEFAKLALVVIDEQHRFGVEQRALLKNKGETTDVHPHQLIMTATPIPRTLAMSLYADLDCSVIDELPPGRTPIQTSVMINTRREEIVARIDEACKQGKQAYWVCPLIDESEVLSCEAATVIWESLKKALPTLTIGLIHGRMKSIEKENTMQAFQKGEIHLLVATTVIEVGVDVPNASLMVIENAERLGLSQLHQLRGRVGRGKAASYCILLYQLPLSLQAKERLAIMRETTDGFKIAERDLVLRGPGEVLGVKQTGALAFRIADLIRDEAYLPAVTEGANTLLQESFHQIDHLVKRWIGKGEKYSKV